MRPHVPDGALTPTDVPDPWGPLDDLVAFGHNYHAYKVAGSLQRVAGLAVEAHDEWSATGTLPASLPRLRLALFHTVRAAGRSAATTAADLDEDTERWVRALVAAIATQVASGTAPGHDGRG